MDLKKVRVLFNMLLGTIITISTVVTQRAIVKTTKDKMERL